MPLTLYDKIWNDHLVDQQDDGTALVFVDQPNDHSKFYRKGLRALKKNYFFSSELSIFSSV